MPTPILPAVEPRVARQAAQWLVLLHSGGATPAATQALEHWRSENPAHELAWQRAERVSQKLGLIPPRLGLHVLQRPPLAPRPGRRALVKTLALLIVAAPASWLAYREQPWQTWQAGEKTATGEQRTLTLPDGSTLILGTASAIDVAFDAQRRSVALYEGEILVQTARDPAPTPRPFAIHSRQGMVRAIGTRFTVRQHDGRSVVAVLQGAVELTPRHAPQAARIIQAGSQAGFTSASVDTPEPLPPLAGAWAQGTLHAERMPLADFCAELSRYRPGLLRCDPAVAALRVSGSFQLRDTDAVLAMLQETLPVRVTPRTRYWVTVGPR